MIKPRICFQKPEKDGKWRFFLLLKFSKLLEKSQENCLQSICSPQHTDREGEREWEKEREEKKS